MARNRPGKREHIPFPTVTVRARGRDQWAFADGRVQCLGVEADAKRFIVHLLHGEIWGCKVILTPKTARVTFVSPTYGEGPHLFDLVSEARLIEVAEKIAGLH